jgi:hypothetical protein
LHDGVDPPDVDVFSYDMTSADNQVANLVVKCKTSPAFLTIMQPSP